RVIGDVAQAGIRIKPESFTASDITNKDGEFLTRVTKRDVAQLRGLLARSYREPKLDPRERWTDKGERQTREDFERTRTNPENGNPVREVPSDEDLDALAEERVLGEGDFDEGPDTELGPRPLPEGRREPNTKAAIARRLQMKRPAGVGAAAFAKALDKRAKGAVPAGFVPTTEVVTDVQASSPYEKEVNAV